MAATPLTLPLAYRFFFLVIEPFSALLGAIFAHYLQYDYLSMTHDASSPSSSLDEAIPTGMSVALSQLANMYFFFALNEALVLRSTADLRVWRVVLSALLVADFGHLWSLRALSSQVYWDIRTWGPMEIGNVPVVYLGAALRIAFLLGVGLEKSTKRAAREVEAAKSK